MFMTWNLCHTDDAGSRKVCIVIGILPTTGEQRWVVRFPSDLDGQAFAVDCGRLSLPEDDRVFDDDGGEHEVINESDTTCEGVTSSILPPLKRAAVAQVGYIDAAVAEVLSAPSDPSPRRIERTVIHRKYVGGLSLLAWNVNGLRGFLKSQANVLSLSRLVRHERPSVIVLTETKLTAEKKDAAFTRLFDVLPLKYDVYSAESMGRKGYAGVAVLLERGISSRLIAEPVLGLPSNLFQEEADEEEATTQGRVLTLEFDKFKLVAVYTPNSGGDLRFLSYRQKWDAAFRSFLEQLRSGPDQKPLIIAGDLNVCGSTLDIGDTRQEAPHCPSIQPCEMEAFARLQTELLLCDTFRLVHPDTTGVYTFYCNSHEKKLNYGRRIDYFLVSSEVQNKVKDAYVYYAEFGLGYRPDHSPILLELDSSLLGSDDVAVQCELSATPPLLSCDAEAEICYAEGEGDEKREVRRRLLCELADTLKESTLAASVMLDLLAPLLYTNEEGLDEDNRNYGIASIVDNLVSKVEADEYPLRVLPRLDEDFVWRTPSRSGIPRELPPLKPVKPRPGPPPPEVKQWLQSHLNLDETCLRDDPTGRSEIEALIMRHWDIFDYDGRNLPEMTGVFHEIQLIEGAQPVYCAPYRMSPDQKRALEDHVKDLLAQNVIEPSQSDWQSPVMFIGKKGGGWRVVQDFRKLNQLTQIPRYPLPLVAQVLDELSTSRVYSAFDARSGFWQVPLAPASRHLTAFGTHIGQFQWRRMPMGLSGSPPTYQRGMNRSYAAILYKCCILYLDDAILYSLLVSGHFEVLEVFFDLTRDADITLTARKMQLFRTSLKYVGMLISNDGVRMDDTKVKAILDMPVNSKSSMKAIRSFLGATNYFRKWLKDYSRVTAPLRRVLKKDAGGWDEECDKAVAQLKRLLTSDPLLVWPDFTKEFELHTDASDIGYGAILVQRDEEGRERVIAFGSRAVGESEKSWTAQEKECFAVIVFTEEFRPYLQDRPFKLVTDAANLKWLLTTEHTTQRLMRWAIRLSAYGIEIVHREGKLNAVADMLSRNVPASMASGCPNAGVTVGSIACERGTQNAENYLEALNDRNADIVMVSGPAGTGKSMLACQAAAKALRDGVVRQIVITRPVVPVGRDIGYIKGSVVDKMSMWIKPLLSYLCKFLSDERVRELQATGGIQVIPISMIRGFSFEDTWIIVDEAQNCSPSELWAVLTRLGTGSRMVVIGDMFQCDLQGKSGFEEVMSKVLALAGSEGARIRCVQLSHVDCRRSPVVKMLLKLKHGANGSDSCRGQHIEHKSSYLSYDSLDSHITEAVQEWIGHTGGIISVSKGSLGLSPETWEMRHVLRSILNSAGVVKMRALFDAVRVEREGLRFLQQHGVLDMDTAIVALDIGFTLSAGVDISSSSFLPGVAPELIEWVGPTVIDALEDAAQGYYSSRYLICGATSNEARDSAEAGVHHKPVREYRSEPAVGNTRRRVAYQDPCQKYGCTRTAMFSDEGLRLCKYCVDLCRNDFCRRPRASSSLYCTNCKRSFGEGEAVFEGLEAAMDVGGQEAEAESDGEVSNDIQRSLDALLISDLQRQNPSPETLRYVKKLQEEDPEIYPVIKYLNGDCAGLTKEAVMKVRAKAERHYLDQLLRRTQYDESLDIVLHQVVVPKALRASLLDFYHTGVENGHPGRYGMYNLLRKQFYWKGMWRDCSECVRRCLTCRSISRGPTAYGNVQQHSRYTSSAMKRVGVDLVGPIYLPEHVREKDVEYPLYCLTMLDVYTGWLELAPLYTKEAKEVAQSIVDNWILRHGPFAELLSDRGGEFLNDTMTHICRILRITHLVSSGHRPQTNGCTERINQELIRKLKIWAEEFEGEWWRALPVVQHALRIIPRRDCGFSPFELLYGRVPHTMLDQMLQDVLSQVQPDVDDYYIKLKRTLNKIRDRFASLRSFSQDRREEEWNEDAQVESFPIGSYVLYYRELGDLKGGSAKLIRRWHGPYVVVERRSAVNYLLADSLDPTCRWLDSFVAHTNCMLKCPEDLKPHFESKYTVPPPSDLWDLNVIPDSVKIGDILLVAGASGDRSMWHVGRVIERHPDNGRILLHLFAVPKESHFTTTRPGPFRPSYKHRLNGGLFVTKGKVNGRTFRMRVCDVTGNNIVRVNVLDSRDYLCASATADLELYGLADSPSSS